MGAGGDSLKASLQNRRPGKLTSWKSDALLLAPILLVFAVVRFPVLFHAAGSQDEEWYAVPGHAVYQQGIPAVPYSRGRSDDSVFYYADKILFAQPPLSFYAQAPFFWVVSGGHAAARLASFSAAVASIIVLYLLARKIGFGRRVAFLAALTFSWSRLLFFPALSARPDMLCGLLGLCSHGLLYLIPKTPGQITSKGLSAASDESRSLSEGRLSENVVTVLAGVLIGLAGLTHAMAIIFALEAAFRLTVLGDGSWHRRVMRLGKLASATAATFAMWIPLIQIRPDLFVSQFVGNILRPAGPGLVSRMLMPWDSFQSQVPQLIERCGLASFLFLAFGLLVSGCVAIRSRDRRELHLWVLTLLSIYLLIVCVGVHPIQGFWCYSAALGWLSCSRTVVRILDVRFASLVHRRVATGVAAILLLALEVPGSGIRPAIQSIRHWNRVDYQVDRFVSSILQTVPPEASITVGPEFAVEAHVDGRDVILGCHHPMYFDSRLWPTDYLMVGRRDEDDHRLQAYRNFGYRVEPVARFGNREREFTHFAELYRLHPPDAFVK